MTGLLGIRAIRVPRAFALAAHAHLQKVGTDRCEGFALWAGTDDGDIFSVRRTIIPEQTAYALSEGVCVTVDGVELHRINRWLFQHGMTLVAQLHSHPTEAYHSRTDDAFAIATTAGSVSLVAPDFARGAFDLKRYAGYRLNEKGRWKPLREKELGQLVQIVG